MRSRAPSEREVLADPAAPVPFFFPVVPEALTLEPEGAVGWRSRSFFCSATFKASQRRTEAWGVVPSFGFGSGVATRGPVTTLLGPACALSAGNCSCGT